MSTSRSRMTWFFVACLAFSAWFYFAQIVYHHAAPNPQENMYAAARLKQLQYLLLLSCWIIPCLFWLARRTFLAWRVPSKLTAAFLGISGILLYTVFGAASVIGALLVAALYALALRTDRPPRETKIRMWVLGLALGGTLFAYGIRTYQVTDFFTLDLYHDGPRLSAVSEALLGGRPYRDFFLHYGILGDVVRPLVAFGIWGTTYVADQQLTPWLTAITGAAVLLASFHLTRSLALSLVIGLILWLRQDFWTPERVWPAAFSLLCFVRGAGERPRWLVASGFFVVVSCLYSLEVGLMLGAGLSTAVLFAFALEKRPRRHAPWRRTLLGFGVGAALFLLYLLSQGSLLAFAENMWSMTKERLPTWADAVNSHLFAYRLSTQPGAWGIFLYLHAVPVVSVLTVSYLLTFRDSIDTTRWSQGWALACVVFFQYFIYVGRSDFIHWKNATVLYVPLLAFIIGELRLWLLATRGETWKQAAPTIVFVGLAGLVCFTTLSGQTPAAALFGNAVLGRDVIPRDNTVPADLASRLPPRLGAFPAPREKLEQIIHVWEGVQRLVPPHGYFFDFTNYGAYYFLTERKNPTRYGFVNYIHGKRMLDTCIRELEARPPQAILMEYVGGRAVYRRDLGPIAEHILAHYKHHAQYGHLALFVPKESHT